MSKRRGSKKIPISNDETVIEKPSATDVLFGRGGHINHNPANQRYLALVCDMKEKYQKCKRTEKADVAWDIIRQLKEQDPPARFLRKDYSTNFWNTVDDAEVRRKISQCLRERGVPICATSKPGKRSKKAVKSRSGKQTGPKAEAEEDNQTGGVNAEPDCPTPGGAGKVRVSGRRVSWQGKEPWAAHKETNVGPSSPSPVFAKSDATLTSTMSQPDGVLSKQSMGFPVEQGMGKLDSVESACIKSPAPPMPAPVPIKFEGSSRVLSDFLAGSFASFAPSIFDYSSGNAWEDLLDSSALPQHAPEDDKSQRQSCSNEEPVANSGSTQRRSYSQFSGNPVGWVEFAPKPHKTHVTESVKNALTYYY